MLHPDVCGGSADGLLAVHSLSKRSNLAGYRCAFVAGDARLVGELLAVRKNLGLMMPGPQQVAMAAALSRHRARASSSTRRYAARRTALRAALESAGFRIDHSEASLYLWATPGRGAAGTPSAGSPTAASWSPRVTSTAPPAPGTYGSPSRRPMSGSTRRSPGWGERSSADR